jgi:pimeloyl-ACP methyl ester carboxylesterase
VTALRRVVLVLAGVAAALLAVLAVVGFLQHPDTSLPPGVRGSHVSVDGTSLRYLQQGTGPDVLLIHGSPGSAEDWDPVLERLAAHFRVTAYDRIGHGYSEGARLPHTPTENARITLGLIRALGLRDVVVVGHSYGGATALRLAIDHPPELRGLVTVGARAYPPAVIEPLYRVVAVPMVGTGVAALLTPFMGADRIATGIRQSFGPNVALIPSGFIEARTRLWTRPTVVATLSQERTTLDAELGPASARYPSITVPLRVVCGVDDVRNYQDAQRLAREVPGAQLVALPQTGHYVQFAHPEAVVAAVEDVAGAHR